VLQLQNKHLLLSRYRLGWLSNSVPFLLELHWDLRICLRGLVGGRWAYLLAAHELCWAKAATGGGPCGGA